MKVKILAMMAASGLMAASFVYVVPAYADEFSGDEEVMASQQFALADNTSASSDLPSDVGGGTNNASDAGNSADNSANSTNNDANPSATGGDAAASQSNDQPTPDVASGDDDY